MPIVFKTINPGERYSALCLLYAGVQIDMNNFMPERFSSMQRMTTMLANPLTMVDYFHNMIDTVIEAIIKGGMFGQNAHYYGAIEYQGRGTPHIHIMVRLSSLVGFSA